jgi:uncharacterized protein
MIGRHRGYGKFLLCFLVWEEFWSAGVALMSDAKPPKEPSMEEIIASINRIIAQNGGAREPILPAVDEKDDVLDLTEAVDEDGRVRRIVPAGPATAPTGAPSSEVVAPVEARLPEPEPPRAEAGKPGEDAEPDGEHVLSAATSAAAAIAFARLGTLPKNGASESELPVGNLGRTLEDIVRDALRPFLRSWLDAHLPALVERLVREEIARVAGKAGLR